MFAVTPQVLLQLRSEGLPHGGCEEPVGGARRGCSEGRVQPGGARRHDPHSHLHRWRPQRLQRRRAQERPRGAPRTRPLVPRTLPPVPLERVRESGSADEWRGGSSSNPSAALQRTVRGLDEWQPPSSEPTLLFPVNLNALTSRGSSVCGCFTALTTHPQEECIYRFNHVGHRTLWSSSILSTLHCFALTLKKMSLWKVSCQKNVLC